MLRVSNSGLLIAAAWLALALTACGKDEDTGPAGAAFGPGSRLLQYVADDSPYVFAVLEPVPDDVMDKFEPQLDVTLKSYRQLLRAVLRQNIELNVPAQEDSGAPRDEPVALLDELGDLFSLEGIRNAGIGRDATMVFYGAGVLPVLRMSLSDAAAFEAALARIEERAGQSMAVAGIDQQSYRYAGDARGRVIIALVGNDLVVSLVPTGLSDASLREILGLTPPAHSLAQSGRLQQIAADNGFKPYGAGYVDFARLTAVFLDEPSGINADVLGTVGYRADVLSPVCKTEIRQVAGVAPRLLAGYTDITVERIAMNSILELRKDIADGLATLAAPVPGMGRDHGGVFSFGMSLDLLAAREFYAARLDALEKDPFQCEHFAELQAGVAEGRQVLDQPMPPVVYGLKGFLAVVENIEGLDLANRQPPTAIDMRFLLATDNAPGLLAMGSMFSPELAGLNLQPDGKPVRFESPQMQAAPFDAAYLAMTDNALGLSVGEGTDAGLGDLLQAPAGEPPPFMSMYMDAGRYYSFIGEAMMASDAIDDAATADVNKAVSDMMQGIAQLTDRFSFNVNFTDRGIEFPTEMTLAE